MLIHQVSCSVKDIRLSMESLIMANVKILSKFVPEF